MKTLSWLPAFLLLLPVWSQDEVPAPFDDGDVGALSSEEPTRFDPDADRPKMIQVTVEWVELSHEKLTELMFLSEPESSDATPLRKQVAELVKAKEAKVLETSMVVARSGERATNQSVSEFYWPTEFQPGQLPNTLTLASETPLADLRTPPLPDAFEITHLGTTLEIAPVLGVESKQIDLNLVPELVWQTGNTTWLETKDSLGNVAKVEMPEFYRLQINTAITCIDGQYNLIAIQSPKGQNGRTDFTRKVMVFVRCDVQVVKEIE